MIIETIMKMALVKLSFRQVIDATSTGSFELNVFNDSYTEFLIQMQTYNQGNRFRTFKDMLHDVPKSASLHYKVGFSIGLYVKQLNKKIPGLKETSGKTNLPFAGHQFELIDSDSSDKSAHQVAITYTTDNLILLDSFGDHLLLSSADPAILTVKEPVETFILKMQENLSISSYLSI